MRASHLSFPVLLCLAALLACEPAAEAESATATPASGSAARPAASSQSSLPAPPLDPAAGAEIGLVVEAFLSPHQESGEEEDTPSSVPRQFRSTTASMSRAEREAAGHRGHGVIRFARDLSRAWVDVRIDGIDAGSINMFHIHCGEHGILGPILVDFALLTDLSEDLSDGALSLELTNQAIVGTTESGSGIGAAFTLGCVIRSPSLESLAPTRVSTIAGMASFARQRQLYFNLHTTGQTYYGDVRGQIDRIHEEGGRGATTVASTP